MSQREYTDNDSPAGTALLPRRISRPKLLPPYHVLLLDDDDHTYAYVIKMLQELFYMPVEQAYTIAGEVESDGRAVVDTTTKERAEFKRDQILGFGSDQYIARCKGSMSAIIEPAEYGDE